MSTEEQVLAPPAGKVVEAVEARPGTALSAEVDSPVRGDGYRVSLDQFEGPLDLLLHLIKRDEVDIHDIPIAHITEQFLLSIQDVESLDLDFAGEFLLMAATLMRIKSRTLIPREDEDLEDEEEDPRAELVRRLLEYREFKKVSELLGDREQEWRGIFERGPSALPEAEDPGTESLDLTMLELYRAFRTVLSNRPDDTPFTLEPEEYSVEERTEAILAECDRNSEGVSFARLFEGTPSRANVITTFLALLELIRKRVLAVNQADLFGEIWLRRTEVGIPDDA